jgi:carbon-monoxide dehydrogenase large subunit
LQIGGSALFKASEEVLAQAKQLAAYMLEASPDDIVIGDGGGLEVAGVPASRLSWVELAGAVKDPARRPEGMAERLAHELDYTSDGSSFPFGSHIAVVEVDDETGRVELLRMIAVDDCGKIVNPLLVAGQQHGGIGQGVAQALYEEVRYDDDGNPITANLMDYAMPSAAELPSYEVFNTETPSPRNPGRFLAGLAPLRLSGGFRSAGHALDPLHRFPVVLVLCRAQQAHLVVVAVGSAPGPGKFVGAAAKHEDIH